LFERSGNPRASLPEDSGARMIVFLTDEREENFQQKIILVTENMKVKF
jgi:hypothetical protein